MVIHYLSLKHLDTAAPSIKHLAFGFRYKIMVGPHVVGLTSDFNAAASFAKRTGGEIKIERSLQ